MAEKWNSAKKVLRKTLLVMFCAILLSQSTLQPAGVEGQVRAYTRMIEFDFLRWTLDALLRKQVDEALRAPKYMQIEDQRQVMLDYLDLVQAVNTLTNEINRIYGDPNIANPDQAAAELNAHLEELRRREQKLQSIAEAVLQQQVSEVVAEQGLGLGGQPIPPVLYRATRLPNALIISPRTVIRQEANISLVPEMTPEEINTLEETVSRNLNVSALVVPIGGVGTYPTMVRSTTNLVWLAEVVSHEWTHNFLTLRPLGMLYMASPQLRTINETTANIAGKELGAAVIARYYPELAPPPVETAPTDQPTPEPAPKDPNVFDFNREMHITRVHVDELLAAGKVEEAEAYMEERRRFIYDNGYLIRKLNQAYFAFYGAYSDMPGGGAGGRDPVGPTVQELRRRSSSLADFLYRIAWVTSYDALLKEVEQNGGRFELPPAN